jgi:hypothetical protein
MQIRLLNDEVDANRYTTCFRLQALHILRFYLKRYARIWDFVVLYMHIQFNYFRHATNLYHGIYSVYMYLSFFGHTKLELRSQDMFTINQIDLFSSVTDQLFLRYIIVIGGSLALGWIPLVLILSMAWRNNKPIDISVITFVFGTLAQLGMTSWKQKWIVLSTKACFLMFYCIFGKMGTNGAPFQGFIMLVGKTEITNMEMITVYTISCHFNDISFCAGNSWRQSLPFFCLPHTSSLVLFDPITYVRVDMSALSFLCIVYCVVVFTMHYRLLADIDMSRYNSLSSISFSFLWEGMETETI